MTSQEQEVDTFQPMVCPEHAWGGAQISLWVCRMRAPVCRPRQTDSPTPPACSQHGGHTQVSDWQGPPLASVTMGATRGSTMVGEEGRGKGDTVAGAFFKKLILLEYSCFTMLC